MKIMYLSLVIFLFSSSCSLKKGISNDTIRAPDENDWEIIKYYDTKRGESRDFYGRMAEAGYEIYYIIERENHIEISGYAVQPLSFERIIDYLEIPDKFNEKPVKIIRGSAFYEEKIKTLKLPAYLEVIEQSAFHSSDIEEIVFNDRLEKIGKGAFVGIRVKNLIIPDSVTEIGSGAFYINRIENLIIGNNIKIISGSAFSNGNIKTVIFPETLEVIENSAFWYNPIEKIIFPDSVYKIGANAFSSLKEIQIGNGVELGISEAYSEFNLFVEFYNRNNKKRGTYKMEFKYVYDGLDGYWIYNGI